MTLQRTFGFSWLSVLTCLILFVGGSIPGHARSQRTLHQVDAPPTEGRWDPRADTLSVRWNGMTIETLVVNAAGDVFAAGAFEWAGNHTAHAIARWDGQDWQPVGQGQFTFQGFELSITAMAVSGSDLYVGGNFTAINGVTFNHLAKWNGTAWSTLGGGVSGPYIPRIDVIAISGTDVYVGGLFTHAGGVPVNSIAKWDGTAWSALGSGVTTAASGGEGLVQALVVRGSDLYVGGHFTYAGGMTVNHIARWNGTTWSALKSGLGSSAYVQEIVIDGSDLYVGGDITSAGGRSTNHVARWDGSDWFPFAGALPNAVADLTMVASRLYSITLGSPTQIRTWTGSSWVVAHTVDRAAYQLASHANTLYVGGDFTAVDTTVANGIAAWDGTHWHALGRGVGRLGHAVDMSVGADGVYISGSFNAAGDLRGSSAARWNGTTWTSFGSRISQVTVGQHGIYGVRGWPGTPPDHELTIVKWNGVGWDALTSPITGSTPSVIHAIVEHGTDLYVAGSFDRAGGASMWSIARWNGSQWRSVGGGIPGKVHALAFIEDDLYVGGDFAQAGDVAAKHIAKWDGQQWSAVGGGVDGSWINALAVHGTDLYVGGRFMHAGDVAAHRIAKWDGQQWSALGMGVFPPDMNSDSVEEVDAIAVDPRTGSVYVGGRFTEVAYGSAEEPTVVRANHLARWDGMRWLSLDRGVNDRVYALGVYHGDLYVTGGFTEASGVPAYGFARWARLHTRFVPVADSGS